MDSVQVELAHIVACDMNGAIGKDNSIPWRCPTDLRFFKEKTLDHVIIMGRLTYESLPTGLKNRTIIVLTGNRDYASGVKGVMVMHTLDNAIELGKEITKQRGNKVLFIAGGGELYEDTLKRVDAVYINRLDVEVPFPDTTYPVRELELNFTLVKETKATDHDTDIEVTFQYFRNHLKDVFAKH